MLQKLKIDSIHMSNYGYLKEKKGKWFSLAKEKDVIIFASVRNINTGKSKDFNVVRNMHLHMHISLLRKTDKEKKKKKLLKM